MASFNTINFENNKIFIIIDNSKIFWFNAKQICKSLNYVDTKHIITKHVEKEDKIQLKNMNITFKIKQQPNSIYINESGLYTLLLSSRNKKSKKFMKWVTSDVLPKLRQQNIFSPDKDITNLLQKINNLENKNKILLNDLKLEKFPEGGIVYVTKEIDENKETYYKIGKTDNMNKRIQIHNSHSIHNKTVVHFIESKCPKQLESCILSMLYKFRYKTKKDYFVCSLTRIKKAFSECHKSIKCVECLDCDKDQTGGSVYKVTYYENKLKEMYDQINISSIL